MTTPKPRIFISYSHRDDDFTQRLVKDISRLFDVWMDRVNLTGGEDWKAEIEKAIRASDVLLFIISPDAVTSPYCQHELNMARQSGKPIVPLLLRPTDPANLPVVIQPLHYIDMSPTSDASAAMAALIAALNKAVSASPSDAQTGSKQAGSSGARTTSPVTASPVPQVTARLNHRNWALLAALCIPALLGSIDITVVAAFLPTLIIELDLGIGTDGVSNATQILTAYLLAYSISLFTVGHLADSVGRKATFLGSLLIYVLGTLLVVNYLVVAELLSGDGRLWALLGGRAVQALGAGAFTAVGITIVRERFAPSQRNLPLTILMAVDTVGWLLGAAWAGVLLQFVAWQTIFLFSLPPIALAAALIWWLYDAPVRERRPLDGVGIALLVGMLLLLNLGVANIGTVATAERGLLALLGALLVGVFYAAWQARRTNPVIDLGLLRRPLVGPMLLANVLSGLALVVVYGAVPLVVNVRAVSNLHILGALEFLQANVLQTASLEAGQLLGLFGVPLALATVLVGSRLTRSGYKPTLLLGALLGAGGYALYYRSFESLLTLSPWTLLALTIIGAAIGLMSAVVAVATLANLDEAQGGSGTSLLLGARMATMSVGISLVTAFGGARVNTLFSDLQRDYSGFLFRLIPEQQYFLVIADYEFSTQQMIAETLLVGLGFCVLVGVVALALRVPIEEEIR